jgi:hypothetical protein
MKREGALKSVFPGITESIGPMCRHIFLILGRVPFPVEPLPGYRARRKEHALPIVRDEFRSAIPQRVARQHCPSPLHRRSQNKAYPPWGGTIYHRIASSVLTGCLTKRGNPRGYRSGRTAEPSEGEVPAARQTTRAAERQAIMESRKGVTTRAACPFVSPLPIRKHSP